MPDLEDQAEKAHGSTTARLPPLRDEVVAERADRSTTAPTVLPAADEAVAKPSRAPHDRRRSPIPVLRTVLQVPLVALGIVAVSVLGSMATWRASEWGDRADRYERLAMQDLAHRHQIRSEIRAKVDEDLRLFGEYEEHDGLASSLWSDAIRMRRRDPALARALTRQSQRERSLRGAVERYFTNYPTLDEEGRPAFDVRQVIRETEADDPELSNLRRGRNERLAARTSSKATNLVGVALVFAGSLFFLTLAQLTTRQIAHGFAAAGCALGLLGLTLFIVV
jgi:hypothetical protein